MNTTRIGTLMIGMHHVLVRIMRRMLIPVLVEVGMFSLIVIGMLEMLGMFSLVEIEMPEMLELLMVFCCLLVGLLSCLA